MISSPLFSSALAPADFHLPIECRRDPPQHRERVPLIIGVFELRNYLLRRLGSLRHLSLRKSGGGAGVVKCLRHVDLFVELILPFFRSWIDSEMLIENFSAFRVTRFVFCFDFEADIANPLG